MCNSILLCYVASAVWAMIGKNAVSITEVCSASLLDHIVCCCLCTVHDSKGTCCNVNMCLT